MARKVGWRSVHSSELRRGSKLPAFRSRFLLNMRLSRLIAGALLVRALWPLVALATDSEPIELRCGVTVRGTLAAGEVARYSIASQSEQRIAIDALDISGNDQLLRLRLSGDQTLAHTCTGRIQPPMRGAKVYGGESYLLEVSDCTQNEPLDYTLTLNTVSAVPENCATLLPCGDEIAGTFTLPGQVDAYRFDGTLGDAVTLQAIEQSDTLDGVELRIFDPDGTLLPAANAGAGGCSSSRSVVLPSNGTYTVLANSCFGNGMGAYHLIWQPRSCPPMTQAGQHSGGQPFAIRTSYDGASVVEIASSALSCGFLDTPGFKLQPNPPLPIVDGRFSARTLRLPVRYTDLDIDGVIADIDGDGRFDQVLGGLSLAKQGERCNFEWRATSLTDSDGDSWSDVAEQQWGSDPRDSTKTPENLNVPTTRLLGPSVCEDFYDNDGNGSEDAADAACDPSSGTTLAAPTLFAGRHSRGAALWFALSDDGSAVTKIATAGTQCGASGSVARELNITIPVQSGRFSVRNVPFGGGLAATWSFDGVLFDADHDGVPDQALGGFRVRLEGSECTMSWWATGYLDSDSDGWSDTAERRLGSEWRPLPIADGSRSVPESSVVPTTALSGPSVCEDGIDNDTDQQIDADSPGCQTSPLTRTPTQVVTATPPSGTRTATPTAGCGGDCDADGEVTVDEVQRGVALLLGATSEACAALDSDRDGRYTVDELVAALSRLLAGCEDPR